MNLKQWLQAMYFAVSVARRMMSKPNAEFTTMSCLHLISEHIFNSFWKVRSFRKWDKVMTINCGDEPSFTVQYQEAFLKQAEHECCSKHQLMSIVKPKYVEPCNFFPSANASRFALSACDGYNFPVMMTHT